MSMKNHPLEMYVADRLSKILNEKCRPTKASGASTEIMDVYNSMFFVECKWTRKTENFILKFKEIDKAYIQASKVKGSNKKVLFIMQNKNEDRIVLIDYNDMADLVGEDDMFNIFCFYYFHIKLNKSQYTLYKEDIDYFYSKMLDKEPNKIPAFAFHNKVLTFYIVLDLEDFFYVLEKYILKGEDKE